MPNKMFKKYALKNGMRVVLAPLHDTKAVTVFVLVKVGSRYEQRSISGGSHFVEHLMFKGTKKRPTSLMITKELDGIGAEYNAFTSKDHTGYYIKANYEKVPILVEMLSDMLFNSVFDPREVERERGVIIEEINMYNDNPIMHLEDLFESTVYGDSPIGWSIAGPKPVIQKVSRKSLLEYYRRYYRPNNMLLVVAGNIDEKIESLIRRNFAAASGVRNHLSFVPARIKQRHPQVHVEFKETEQVQLGLGFPAYSYFSAKLYPLYLLSVIMGGNMSSRLFMSIREKKSLCYFIRSSVTVFEDTGTLFIQAGLDKKRIESAVTAILQELTKVRRSGVTPAELKQAKEYLKGRLILNLEASDNVASWLGSQELLERKILTPAQHIERLERITRADVLRVAREIITTPRLNLSLIGPYKSGEQFRRLLRV